QEIGRAGKPEHTLLERILKRGKGAGMACRLLGYRRHHGELVLRAMRDLAHQEPNLVFRRLPVAGSLRKRMGHCRDLGYSEVDGDNVLTCPKPTCVPRQGTDRSGD